ncbi:manganese efflux pump MntP [Desulforamulus aquiferis]|uniref:Putative manganese efflux pump MntP n=1 Tax=Desulforamulus aquiferis TaxID=1397668 RepID=A0AAW7ZC71_9FIRM|nr:manganese efflux pump MntP family protein [Desulforamulus aquiferis]MDO7786819.1 manganese efflux pump MntP family protein [Desulforamulus aquiferis]
MSLLTLLALAVALGSDAFSLCVGIGMAGVNKRQIAIISLTVLVFHIFMPLLGWYAGGFLGERIGRAAGIAGAALLVYLGVKMIWDVYKAENEGPHFVITNTGGLLLLSASVSLDALSVGFTLGTQQVSLLLAAGIIGLVAGLMTLAGLTLGKYIGGWIGDKAQLVGGVILAGIGIKLFF